MANQHEDKNLGLYKNIIVKPEPMPLMIFPVSIEFHHDNKITFSATESHHHWFKNQFGLKRMPPDIYEL